MKPQLAALIGTDVFATEHDLCDRLTEMAESSTQTATARQLGISVAYLGDILHGRRPISEAVARKLGWKRITIFIQE